MDTIYTIMASMLWYNCYDILRRDKVNHKVSSNIIAGLHCISVLFFNLCNNLHILNIINFPNYYSYIQNISIGFYLYDTYVIFTNTELFKFSNYILIYHHISSITALYSDPIIYMMPSIFFWAEVGNVGIYPVYHYIQMKNAPKELKFWKKVQVYTYAPIRIFVLGYYTVIAYNNIIIHDGRFEIWYMLIIIYILGVYWSIGLISKYLK